MQQEPNHIPHDPAVPQEGRAEPDRPSLDTENMLNSSQGTAHRFPVQTAVSIGITVLCAVTGVLLWGSLYFRGNSEPDSPPVAVTPVSTNSTTGIQRYLRAWEGKLALFTGDNPAPDQVYDVYIQTLPPEEQERLSQGIAVDSDEELAGWLEDYTS